MWPTLQEAMLGFATGIAVALSLAVLIELSPWLRRGTVSAFGRDANGADHCYRPSVYRLVRVRFAAKGAHRRPGHVFPVAVSTVDGLSSADRDMVRLLRSMGAGKWQIFRMVRFPHALPYVFSGLKIAATYSVLGAVIAEWLGADAGLGVMLVRAQNSFSADNVFVAIVVITFWSLVLFGFIQAASRLLAPWAYTREQEQWERKNAK